MSILIPGDNLDKSTNGLWNKMFWQDVNLPDFRWSTFVFPFALLTTHTERYFCVQPSSNI